MYGKLDLENVFGMGYNGASLKKRKRLVIFLIFFYTFVNNKKTSSFLLDKLWFIWSILVILVTLIHDPGIYIYILIRFFNFFLIFFLIYNKFV